MITISCHGNLADLLSRKFRKDGVISFDLQRKTSVKDLIESVGIPHPEIDQIIVENKEVDFNYIVAQGVKIDVYPISSKTDFFKPTILRPTPLESYRFVVDVNVAKLTPKLRQLGFDTLYQNNFNDEELALVSGNQQRVLLTRDCNLLKRKVVDFGHLVRAGCPDEQIVEVIELFNLKKNIRPYSRCLTCNGDLLPVSKEEILHLLQPLTRKYYNHFCQCLNCQKLYWAGSHREKMDHSMVRILSLVREGKTNN